MSATGTVIVSLAANKVLDPAELETYVYLNR